jgi:pilus assembly protein Flp/PilA
MKVRAGDALEAAVAVPLPIRHASEAVPCLVFFQARERSVSEEGPMKSFFAQFVSDEQGQDLIEYGLLIGIVTVATIAAITALCGKVGKYFTNLNTSLP